jgi:septal ring-binding cell division protein DamX
MKRYFCLIAAMLAAAATPALASEPNPSAPPALAAVQRTADHQVMGEQVRQGRARLREGLEARKRDAKQRPRAVQHEANGLCTACPDKGAKAHHHSVSNDRKPDCPECISQAIDA